VTVNNAFEFSQLTCNVISNSITNASTLTLRANAGNAGSVAVSCWRGSPVLEFTDVGKSCFDYI
jgi:hypothetical protein